MSGGMCWNRGLVKVRRRILDFPDGLHEQSRHGALRVSVFLQRLRERTDHRPRHISDVLWIPQLLRPLHHNCK